MKKPVQKYSIEDLKKIRGNLTLEFTKASKGEKTSLTFAKHSITNNRIKNIHTMQVIVIGGSNIVSALLKIKDNEITIESKIKDELPILKDRETVLSLVKKYLLPNMNWMGVNFAYPLSPLVRNNIIDGTLIKGTKDHTMSDLIGKPVGEELEHFLNGNNKNEIKIALANDTICLIMAGKNKWPLNTLAGGVVGTGFNFGFILDEKTVVNLESGNFNNFNPTDTGKLIDEESNNRGYQLFEKEVSGAYLYRHYNLYAEKYSLSLKNLTSTKELNDLAQTDSTEAEYAQLLFDRSASLVATHLSAIYDFKNNNDLNILIEGSLYWQGYNFESSVHRYLKQLDVDMDKVTINHIDDSYIYGAARLII